MDRIIRCQRTPPLRLRAEGEVRRAVGYASVFDEWTRLFKGQGWEVREVIRPGAFRNALAEGQDVRALVDHNPSLLLGRTKAGTLRLREDSRGLAVEIDLPGTSAGRDAAESMDRGDLSQMSFAFLPRPGGERTATRMENGVELSEIEITDVDLFDVSIVTYPAYEGTSVEVRGGLTTRQQQAVKLAELRAKIREIEGRIKPATAGGRR